MAATIYLIENFDDPSIQSGLARATRIHRGKHLPSPLGSGKKIEKIALS